MKLLLGISGKSDSASKVPPKYTSKISARLYTILPWTTRLTLLKKCYEHDRIKGATSVDSSRRSQSFEARSKLFFPLLKLWTLFKQVSNRLSDPAPTNAPSKKSPSWISWMGWNCPPRGQFKKIPSETFFFGSPSLPFYLNFSPTNLNPKPCHHSSYQPIYLLHPIDSPSPHSSCNHSISNELSIWV
jgi:hypothetical protein